MEAGAADNATQDATAVDGKGATGTGENDMDVLDLTDADEKFSQESTNGVTVSIQWTPLVLLSGHPSNRT